MGQTMRQPLECYLNGKATAVCDWTWRLPSFGQFYIHLLNITFEYTKNRHYLGNNHQLLRLNEDYLLSIGRKDYTLSKFESKCENFLIWNKKTPLSVVCYRSVSAFRTQCINYSHPCVCGWVWGYHELCLWFTDVALNCMAWLQLMKSDDKKYLDRCIACSSWWVI